MRVLIGRLLFYEFVTPKRISLKCSLHNTLIPNLVKPLMHFLPKGADAKYRSLCSKLYRSFFFQSMSFSCRHTVKCKIYQVAELYALRKQWPVKTRKKTTFVGQNSWCMYNNAVEGITCFIKCEVFGLIERKIIRNEKQWPVKHVRELHFLGQNS